MGHLRARNKFAGLLSRSAPRRSAITNKITNLPPRPDSRREPAATSVAMANPPPPHSGGLFSGAPSAPEPPAKDENTATVEQLLLDLCKLELREKTLELLSKVNSSSSSLRRRAAGAEKKNPPLFRSLSDCRCHVVDLDVATVVMVYRRLNAALLIDCQSRAKYYLWLALCYSISADAPVVVLVDSYAC